MWNWRYIFWICFLRKGRIKGLYFNLPMKGVVGINRLQMTDERILAFIQRNFRCRFLDIIMPIISAMGNVGGVWLATGIAFCISKTYRYYGFILVGTLLLCGLVGNLSLKPLVARARPCHRYPDYPLLITRPFYGNFNCLFQNVPFCSLPQRYFGSNGYGRANALVLSSDSGPLISVLQKAVQAVD